MPNARIYWLHALSPTHAGTGRGVGYIDLPIDRDGVTGWPIIRGSAFKGVVADHYGATPEVRKKDPLLRAAFGIADGNESSSGALMPTDAQIVCLPVRSFRGTFAWAASPLCLRLLRRTLELTGFSHGLPAAPGDLADTKAHYASPSALAEDKKIYLEDLDFDGAECPTAAAWADFIGASVFGVGDPWAAEFRKRFVVLPDAAFDFLCETGTEVHTRVRIDPEMKIVARGALWTEESLPAESILAGIVQCDRVFQNNGSSNGSIQPADLLAKFAPTDAKDPLVLQIGGKATVGRGRMRCIFTEVKG
jgi:CRISPR-associated protein Cmr4